MHTYFNKSKLRMLSNKINSEQSLVSIHFTNVNRGDLQEQVEVEDLHKCLLSILLEVVPVL